MSLDDIDLDSWKEKKEEKPQGEAPAGDSSGSTAGSTKGSTTGDTSGNTRAEAGVTSGATPGPQRKSRADRERSVSRLTDIPATIPRGAWNTMLVHCQNTCKAVHKKGRGKKWTGLEGAVEDMVKWLKDSGYDLSKLKKEGFE